MRSRASGFAQTTAAVWSPARLNALEADQKVAEFRAMSPPVKAKGTCREPGICRSACISSLATKTPCQ